FSRPLRARNGAIVGLMLLAGLRKHEVLTLDVADVDLDARHAVVRVKAGKGRHGGKPRTVPLTDELRALCAAYAEARKQLGRAQPKKVLGYTRFFAGNRASAALSDSTLRRLFSRVS